MPVKKRAEKARRFKITPEAAARWHEVKGWALGRNHVADDALAEALGVPVLLAIPDDEMAEIRAGLESTE